MKTKGGQETSDHWPQLWKKLTVKGGIEKDKRGQMVNIRLSEEVVNKIVAHVFF